MGVNSQSKEARVVCTELSRATHHVRLGVAFGEGVNFDDEQFDFITDQLSQIVTFAKSGIKLIQRERARRGHKKLPKETAKERASQNAGNDSDDDDELDTVPTAGDHEGE